MIGVRGLYIIFTIVLTSLVTWKFAGAAELTDDFFAVVVSVFSILAGVLVAVISIVGDPSMLLPGNWRVGFEHAKDMQKRLSNFSHLFLLYILSMFVIACYMLFSKALGENAVYLKYVLIWLSSTGFILSIPLPYSLMSIQKERMREEVRKRMARNGDLSPHESLAEE